MAVLSGLELIQSFVVVAEELSFRRSAERMNIDQSALSRRIQKLEDLLQFPLFERTTRDVSLTPAGQAFYDGSVRLLQDYTSSIDAARLVAEGKTGTLRIACIIFAAMDLMPKAVALYRKKNPFVDISLCHLGTQDQKVALANDEIDIGYIVGPFDYSEYRSIQIKSEPLCVVMPPSHPLAEKEELKPEDLNGFDLILYDKIEAYYWRLSELFSNRGVRLKSRLEPRHTLAVIGLVAAGLGITVYPQSVSSILGPDLETRPISDPDFNMQTLLVWRHSNRTKALRDFVEVASDIDPR